MPLSRRRSNYELAHSIEVLLRRLTSSGMTKDKLLAEDLIRDLHERLCPRAPPVAAFEKELPFLRPMSEAPRDGSSIIARLKPARTPGIESKRKTRDRKVGWQERRWLDRTVAGCYWQDDAFDGWRR